MKLALILTVALCSIAAWPQVSSGTVVFANFSQDEITVAADSRSTSSDGIEADDECKISTFGNKFAFFMSGVAHRERDTRTVWSAHSVARQAWKKEVSLYPNDAFGLAVATEREWARQMKILYADPQVVEFRRHEMKPGDFPTLANGFFVATDNTGKLVLHSINISFDVNSRGEIKIIDNDRIDVPVNSHDSAGLNEVINEFMDMTSPRAQKYMPWFYSTLTELSPAQRNARIASKMIELSILLHPRNAELGFPVDLIQMRSGTGLKILSMKQGCRESHEENTQHHPAQKPSNLPKN